MCSAARLFDSRRGNANDGNEAMHELDAALDLSSSRSYKNRKTMKPCTPSPLDVLFLTIGSLCVCAAILRFFMSFSLLCSSLETACMRCYVSGCSDCNCDGCGCDKEETRTRWKITIACLLLLLTFGLGVGWGRQRQPRLLSVFIGASVDHSK